MARPALPPTLHSLNSMRLDRLARGLSRLIRAAARDLTTIPNGRPNPFARRFVVRLGDQEIGSRLENRGGKNKGKPAAGLPSAKSEFAKTRLEKLEAHAESEFELPRRVALCLERSPVSGVVQAFVGSSNWTWSNRFAITTWNSPLICSVMFVVFRT